MIIVLILAVPLMPSTSVTLVKGRWPPDTSQYSSLPGDGPGRSGSSELRLSEPMASPNVATSYNPRARLVKQVSWSIFACLHALNSLFADEESEHCNIIFLLHTLARVIQRKFLLFLMWDKGPEERFSWWRSSLPTNCARSVDLCCGWRPHVTDHQARQRACPFGRHWPKADVDIRMCCSLAQSGWQPPAWLPRDDWPQQEILSGMTTSGLSDLGVDL